MSIKDVTAVIDAKSIKRYCDSNKTNDNECNKNCVFYFGSFDCLLPDILGMNGEDDYIDAKAKIRARISELSK